MKQILKFIAGSALLRSGIFPRLFRERAVILAFHRVNDLYDDSLTVRVECFRAICELAKAQFTVVPLAEIVRRLERGLGVGNLLAITFDDGYEDNYLNAAPILEELGLPATFFVVSEFLDSDTVAWWDADLKPRPTWMRRSQVADLIARGFQIGGHTMTHVDLGKVPQAVAERELAGCRERLQSQLGEVDVFAYPYGGEENLAETNRSLIAQAGFRCCVSCYGGTVKATDDPYRLRRVPVSSWYRTPQQFALEVALGRA